MTWDINWFTNDAELLRHPLYQRYSTLTVTGLIAGEATIKNELKAMLANRESAALIAYFCWLLRLIELAS